MSKCSVYKTCNPVIRWTAVILVGIPVFLINLGLHLVLLIQKIKLNWIGNEDKTQISHFRGSRIYEVADLSTEEKKDFKKHRSTSYINEMTFGSLWEFSEYLGNKLHVPLIEDDVMYEAIMKSPFCHGLKKEVQGDEITWHLSFSLDKYKVFPGYYWDIKELILHANSTISLVDRTGGIHTPSSSTWNLAKAHAQSQLTFFAPGLAHNYVHFVFPTLMASFIRSVLPLTSVLRQLAEPHTRFTQYINYQALNVCQSSSNTDSLADALFRPWLSFPVTNDQFLAGVERNCERVYYDDDALTQELHEELPYHRFLKSFYDVFRRYVERLHPLLEDDYQILSSAVEEYLPAVKGRSVVDVVTTLLWNCAVVHFSDHSSYLKLFGNKYGCMAIRIPLVTEEGDCGTTNCSEKSSDDRMSCPMFAASDIYHTRCFYRTFVRYNQGSSLDLTLKNTQYNFSDPKAIEASEEFFKDLDLLDENLQKKGEDIVPMKTMIRTVCF